MPTNQARNQAQLDRQAIEALAVIGGQRTRDEDITFSGTSFNFPEQFRGDLDGLWKFVERYVIGQREQTTVTKTFDYRPMDGAHATYVKLKEYFGYAQSTAKAGRFGPTPPAEITIAIGYVDGVLQHTTVPWGNMVLPMVGATLEMTIIHDRDRGDLFVLNTYCRKVDRRIIDGLYKEIERYLATNSIYRGHAVNGEMEFFDTDQVDPNQFVYEEQVWVDAETHIFSPMRDAVVLAARGMDPKRVVLLEGAFGTGKSGLGRIAAKVAVANGWTALFCRPGQDNPFNVMQTAQLYLPIEGKGGCMVFMEDIDVLSSRMGDPTYTSRLLDTFDGFETKGKPFVLVMTTNHAEEITQGMTRPGRIHAIISIGAMDRAGVERLTRTIIGEQLAPDVDFDAVYAATDGYMPAFVREAIERAVRYTIARVGDVAEISTTDLVHACRSLRGQFNLHMAARDRPNQLPQLDAVFRDMFSTEVQVDTDNLQDAVLSAVETKLHGAVVVNADSGDTEYEINTTN